MTFLSQILLEFSTIIGLIPFNCINFSIIKGITLFFTAFLRV